MQNIAYDWYVFKNRVLLFSERIFLILIKNLVL